MTGATIPRAVDAAEVPALQGMGIHSGAPARVRLLPGTTPGIVFRRVDMPGAPEIPAIATSLTPSVRNTTLSAGGASVGTVEHLLGACWGLGITSLTAEVSGPELPAGDGSARIWAEALGRGGCMQAPAPARRRIERTVVVQRGTRKLVLAPAAECSVIFAGEFPDGTVAAAAWARECDFTAELADARTFCRLSEVVALREQGLIAGGTLRNALVWMDTRLDNATAAKIRRWWPAVRIETTDDGLMPPGKLRWRNEPARHKLVDLLGDLVLISDTGPWRVTAWNTGHDMTHELVQEVARCSTKWPLHTDD